MKEQGLQAAIVELKGILKDMKTLFEWYRLKRFEATRRSSLNLVFYDTTINDLNDKYFLFLLLASRIHTGLNNQNIPESKLKIIKKELTKIELQAFYLGSGIRFY